MSDEETRKPTDGYEAPEGSSKTLQFALSPERSLEVEVRAEWIVLRKKERPAAEMFHVAYLASGAAPESRPVTFVFNGGPGAASAYLHVGAIGPRRIRLEAAGSVPAPPVELVHNAESWLEFTDLVFIDPVGTGFSRIIDRRAGGDAAKNGTNADDSTESTVDESEFYDLKRDLESLGEFMQRFLSANHRWRSPVFIAGESYGGFRVARLVKLLQQGYGIGLNGAILLSPALEFGVLSSSDYDVLPWIDVFPSMALSAFAHERADTKDDSDGLDDFREQVEEFVVRELPLALIDSGEGSEKRRMRGLRKAARLMGLDEDAVVASGGRVRPEYFARNLLRDERRVCGLYDASITVIDPFPDRDTFQGPDPTLAGIERAFTAGINAQLREYLGVSTEREYHLLSYEVNKAWKTSERDGIAGEVGSVDDLRYGMCINPHMRVLISHGYYDLVTPYYTSKRIAGLMKLEEDVARRLSLINFEGGHMFYTWDESRARFRETVRLFYQQALRDRHQRRGLYGTATAHRLESE